MTLGLLFAAALFLIACGLGFILFLNWQADRAWQRILREISEDCERAVRLTEYHGEDR